MTAPARPQRRALDAIMQWTCSSIGRAPSRHDGSCRFESCHVHSERMYNWHVFEQYRVYGPYTEAKTGRQMVTLYSKEYRTTMPYPRYLMSVKLGRILGPGEQVDHINNDRSDNRMENLQVVTPSENLMRRGTGERFEWITCGYCGREFTRSRRQLAKPAGKNALCCSRSCAVRLQKKLAALT
jgi:hypothetical protein